MAFPPIFIIGGFSFHWLMEKNKIKWLNPLLIFAVVLPRLLGIISLHPYQYTYYNSFVGGTRGAFRRYETDYWLTCYKEVFDQLNKNHEKQKVFVHRNKYLASQYVNATLLVEQFEPDLDTIRNREIYFFSAAGPTSTNKFMSMIHRYWKSQKTGLFSAPSNKFIRFCCRPNDDMAKRQSK